MAKVKTVSVPVELARRAFLWLEYIDLSNEGRDAYRDMIADLNADYNALGDLLDGVPDNYPRKRVGC